jgi:glutaredoxin 3
MNAVRPRVIVYSSPFCGFCHAAKRLLERKGIAFEEVDVMFDRGKRDEMIGRSNRKTVPQVFVDDRHIGGYDDLSVLELTGELDTVLRITRQSNGLEDT